MIEASDLPGRVVGPSGEELTAQRDGGYSADMTMWQYAQLTVTVDRCPTSHRAHRNRLYRRWKLSPRHDINYA